MKNLIKFSYESRELKIEKIDDEPFFCLVDVCHLLGISNSRKTIERLDEKGVTKTYAPTAGGVQKLTFVNEPNLYRVIFRSDKPEARKLQDWVFEKVLPEIRKTGRYISEKERRKIKEKIEILEFLRKEYFLAMDFYKKEITRLHNQIDEFVIERISDHERIKKFKKKVS